MSADVTELWESLDGRRRPEDVAAVALRVVGADLSADERRAVAKAARLAERPSWWSMQPSDWERPVWPAKQLETLAVLLADTPLEGPMVDPTDMSAVRVELARVSAGLDGAGLSRRRTERIAAQLRHTEAKVARVERVLRRRTCALVGRAGLVEDISAGDLAPCPATAAFVAYYAARRNVRREFTLAGKSNPFDDVAAALFANLERSATPRWDVVARVYPAPRVTARLSMAQNLHLAARWSSVMVDAAELARSCAGVASLHRDTMSVFRGLDSDTWNLAAQAYNEARAAWFSTMDAAAELETVRVGLCPPKLMRVMAADLVAWTLASGGQRDPNIAVAASLPWPWEIFDGTRSCGLANVVGACTAAGVDPVAAGWVGPRAPRVAARFEPTPELVHGIAVADPMVASLLRRSGVFSGKSVDWDVVAEAERAGWFDEGR